ncbi:MAG: TrmH family RNA methyltransferase [Parcubacteria group bacterium]|nr:TrmH family RNA methyltransferase [Parcubacteria group bacterium]
MRNHKEVVVVLHNIRSTHNVGSIFRTAEAAGVSKIYLVGHTPAPIDRFSRIQKEIQKTALGAEKTVFWEQVTGVVPLIKLLRQNGFYVIAIEQDKKSIDYKTIHPKKKTAFVFGNEVSGIPASVLKYCDIIAEIPMKGKKESLNVSVAAGAALFRILNI